jgi:hypothetical protein
MFPNEDVLAFGDKRFASPSVEVSLHAILFLSKTLLRLLEIIRHTVLSKERLGLVLVILLCRVNERRFKVLFVNVKAGFIRICLIQPQRHQRVHDLFHEALINSFAVSLEFDETEDRAGQFRVFPLDGNKQVVFPLNECKLGYLSERMRK